MELIHLQHEFNMFGLGVFNAAAFILLPPLLRLFGIKVVTTIHAVVAPSQVNLEFLDIFGWPCKKFWLLPIKIFLRLLYTTTCLFSNKIIVHSTILKNILIKDYWAKERKINVLPIGIPESPTNLPNNATSTIWLTANCPRPTANNYLLYFGYFHKRKGLRELIYAFQKVHETNPKLRLVLAGGTLQKSYEDEIKNIVATRNLNDSVIFTGFVGLPQLRWLLNSCLAVVLPLTYSVAGSGPLAEVAAHHKPLVTTSVGVNAGELTDGKNALLVPPKDVAALTKAILQIIEQKALRNKLSKGMGDLQRERSWKKVAEKTKSFYGSVF